MSLVLKQSLIVTWHENDQLPNKLTIFVCILKAVSQKHVALFFLFKTTHGGLFLTSFLSLLFHFQYVAISPSLLAHFSPSSRTSKLSKLAPLSGSHPIMFLSTSATYPARPTFPGHVCLWEEWVLTLSVLLPELLLSSCFPQRGGHQAGRHVTVSQLLWGWAILEAWVLHLLLLGFFS